MAQGLFGTRFDQINFFLHLYALWQRETDAQCEVREENVLVYLDQLTKPDGQELVCFAAPTWFE